MRRIFYFLATNLAIMLVLSVVLMIISPFLPEQFRSAYGGQLFIAALFGFGGSIFSLLTSKSAAKKFSGVQIITEPSNETEQWLLDTVSRQAKQAGIGMPEVGIFPAPEMNAFATGANKNSALVAVSAGLLQSMTREEAEAVMGHEIAHVANGDMVTLTLIQGIVNTFVFFLARLVAQVIDRDGRGIGYYVTYFAAQAVFGFAASVIVAYFSRQREFRADTGGAQYSETKHMIAALERLKQGQPAQLPNQLAAFGINSGMKAMFSTHPPLDQRINALRNSM